MRRLVLIVVGIVLSCAAQIPAPDPVWEAYRAWEKQQPQATNQDQWKARGRSLYEASGEWIRRWPENHMAWDQRRSALVQTHSRSPDDWKEVAEGLIRTSSEKDRDSVRRLLAQDWIAAGVWLREASDLFKAVLKQPEPPNDGSLRGQLDTAYHAMDRWVAFENLARAGLKLKDLDQARNAIQDQRRWLDKEFREHFIADPRAWPDHEARHLRNAAELAEAENHKLDALAYYRPILANPYYAQEYSTSRIAGRAHPIWKDLGGTDSGWNIWSQLEQPLEGYSLLPAGVPLRPWVKVRQPLPDVKLASLQCALVETDGSYSYNFATLPRRHRTNRFI